MITRTNLLYRTTTALIVLWGVSVLSFGLTFLTPGDPARTIVQKQYGRTPPQEVVDAFTKVAENAEATDSGIQDISETADDQAASTEEAVSMVEQVADISRATADESENASAAAEKQAASMSQVSANVTSLSDGAERLQSLLSAFDVGGTESRSDGPDTTTGAPTL